MSAVEALRAAQMAGIDIRIDGDKLALEADAPPPPAILELLARHKPGIIALLKPARFAWDRQDWQVYFEERSAIAEYDGGMPRDQAEALAIQATITRWLNDNPAESNPADGCARCGKAESPDAVVVPFGMGPHVWLHHSCWHSWYAERQAEARSAISSLLGLA